jgi:hypothetical protein
MCLFSVDNECVEELVGFRTLSVIKSVPFVFRYYLPGNPEVNTSNSSWSVIRL